MALQKLTQNVAKEGVIRVGRSTHNLSIEPPRIPESKQIGPPQGALVFCESGVAPMKLRS